MASGVTIVDPATAYIGPDVAIAADTIIHPNVHLEGPTIGSGCEIQCGVRIVNSALQENVFVNSFCVITDSHIARGAARTVRPHPAGLGDRRGRTRRQLRRAEEDRSWARARRSTTSRISATRSWARTSTSAPARSPATTTARRSIETTIEDGAFIGSDSQLVAPVTIGEGAYVAAGSSITENVPAGSSPYRAASKSTKRAGSTEEEEIIAMCGIIGYIGSKQLVPILIDGLRRLEYRGYDSAGVAVVRNGSIELRRSAGAGAAGGSHRHSSARRRIRHRPHPLGHARQADRGERAPAPRLHQPHRCRPQRIIENHSS